MKLSSLGLPNLLMITISGAAKDESFFKMEFQFQYKNMDWWKNLEVSFFVWWPSKGIFKHMIYFTQHWESLIHDWITQLRVVGKDIFCISINILVCLSLAFSQLGIILVDFHKIFLSFWKMYHLTDCWFSYEFSFNFDLIQHGAINPRNYPHRMNFVVFCWGQAPVPLMVFRSNSKFDQNMERYSLKYVQPITTEFRTRHNSYNVITCAKFHCDR